MAGETKLLHYLGIALAVFIGEVAARLLYAYVVTKAVVTEIEAFGEQIQEHTRRIKEKNARDTKRRRQAVEQERRHSKMGRDLYRRCAEYTQFYQDHPSEYAYEQRQKTCSNYNTYVRTGRRTP